jgi:hypothetical protein
MYNEEKNFLLVEKEQKMLIKANNYKAGDFKKQFNSEFWTKFRAWQRGETFEKPLVESKKNKGGNKKGNKRGNYFSLKNRMSKILDAFKVDYLAGLGYGKIKEKYNMSHHTYKVFRQNIIKNKENENTLKKCKIR